MRVWYTFGAFGNKVIELNWCDVLRLLAGRDVEVRGTGTIISIGRSHAKSLGKAPSREKQLGLSP